MRTGLGIAVGLVFFCCTAIASGQAPKDFVTKWQDAQAAARKANKPIFIHFTTADCPKCGKIVKDALSVDAAKKALADFVCVSLDCTKNYGQEPAQDVKVNLSLKEKLGGDGCHFLVMVTFDGVVLNTVTGPLTANELLNEITIAKGVYKEYQDFKAFELKAKKDYAYWLKALVLYHRVRHEERAMEAAAKVLELDPENDEGDAVLAKLVQLEFSAEMPEKTLALVEEICKLDPNNAKTAYEKAMTNQVYREFSAARSADSRTEATSHLEEAIRLAEKVNSSKVTLKDPAKFHSLAAAAYFSLNESDKAIASAEKALALSKDKRRAAAIKEFIDQVKELKKKPPQSKPADEPSPGPIP